MPVCKCASMQVHKYASAQVCKCTSMQVYKYASVRVYKYASIQICKCTSMFSGAQFLVTCKKLEMVFF